MEQRASGSEATRRIPRTRQSSQQLTEDVTPFIKREEEEDRCIQNPKRFSETRNDYREHFSVLLTNIECKEPQECSASLNCGLRSTFDNDKETGSVSATVLTSMIKSEKNEDDQHGSEPWSVLSGPENITLPTEAKQEEECKLEVEDEVMYKFEPGFGQHEAYSEDPKCRRHAELHEHSNSDTCDSGKILARTFVNTCNVKAQHNTELVRQAGGKNDPQVEVFVCSRCNYSATEKDCLRRHMKIHHNDTTRKCSRTETERQKDISVNAKAQRRLVVNLYKCAECDFTTKYKRSLTTHAIVKHNSDAPVYKCQKCSYATKRKDDLSKHIKIHHNKHAELHKCSHCDYVTKYKPSLTQHLKVQHDPNAKLYKCTVCDYAAKQASDLRKHVARRHNSCAPVYQCPECRYEAASKTDLIEHIRVYHEHESARSSVFSSPRNMTLPAEAKQEEECKTEVEDHVLYQFEPGLGKQEEAYDEGGEHAELREHGTGDIYDPGKPFVNTSNVEAENDTYLLGHSNSEQDSQVEVFVCFRCDYSVTEKNRLRKHVKICRNDTARKCSETDAERQTNTSAITKAYHPVLANLKCTECEFTTKVKNRLTQHVTRKHSWDDPIYKCRECSYITKAKVDLSEHIKVHQKRHTELHKCPHCDYVTKYKSGLTQHVKVQHDPDAKLYKCTVCDYATKHARDLPRHVTIKHSPNAPLYRCAKCEFTTKFRSYLTKHVTIKHDSDAPVYQCTECRYATKWKSDLSKHVKLLHNRQAECYKCPHCEYAPKCKQSLTQHLKVQHSSRAKVYKCPICDFATKYVGNLTTHVTMKHDSDASLYQCTL